MRSGADVEMHPRELDNKQITRLHQLLHEAKFKDPDGSHLSPAGQLIPLGILHLCHLHALSQPTIRHLAYWCSHDLCWPMSEAFTLLVHGCKFG